MLILDEPDSGLDVTAALVTGTVLAVIRGMDMWQRRERVESELDELVDPPTLRLGLME